eukprot:CAMPEP_0177699158 /NCGR_PEP_ID=MMETSP0484_2-20121128/5437_1 /TAXON_ID=354590 /ORGANISM="Rhodomonas lens, Strain RHODO" /LENGTH=69 /DNA_ID=CAMNT_0019210323 /DNA_START=182 /DNA_END=391 /DNA_ORIENTATION=-
MTPAQYKVRRESECSPLISAPPLRGSALESREAESGGHVTAHELSLTVSGFLGCNEAGCASRLCFLAPA